jgi:hypothetical protein
MRGCRRACTIQLNIWALIAAGLYLYAASTGRTGLAMWPLSIVIGLLATMALLIAHSALEAAKERRMLMRSCEGVRPGDGEWVAACGAIHSSAPMASPITAEKVVAYEYSISRDQRVGGRSTLMTYFDGKALAASTISTPAGEVRLLAVPALEVGPAHVETSRAVANAREYLRHAVFEQRDSARQRTSALEREWTDDDGVFRIDRKYSNVDVELSDDFRFEERHLKPGDIVCAFGVYSVQRGGLVPDTRWGRRSRITRGSAADAARDLRGRSIRYAIGSLILGAAAIGIAIGWLAA